MGVARPRRFSAPRLRGKRQDRWCTRRPLTAVVIIVIDRVDDIDDDSSLEHAFHDVAEHRVTGHTLPGHACILAPTRGGSAARGVLPNRGQSTSWRDLARRTKSEYDTLTGRGASDVHGQLYGSVRRSAFS